MHDVSPQMCVLVILYLLGGLPHTASAMMWWVSCAPCWGRAGDRRERPDRVRGGLRVLGSGMSFIDLVRKASASKASLLAKCQQSYTFAGKLVHSHSTKVHLPLYIH